MSGQSLEILRSCDLMLNWNVMQSRVSSGKYSFSCDLMLNWNVMQFMKECCTSAGVVI